MPPLTRRPTGETTRKLGWLLGWGLLAALGGSGCATPGPNHVYITMHASPAVHDLGPATATVAGALRPGEQAVGLAYDFNTDHLFVRVAPTQVIRVIERPSGKILREMPLPPELHSSGPADLAIRSSDRHLFAAHPDGRSVVELTLFGDFVSRTELRGLDGRVRGLAYDQREGRLLVLLSTSPAVIATAGPDGTLAYYAKVASTVNPVSLGYDSDAQHFFVPLTDGNSLGEFDSAGRPVATHPAGGPITTIDAGPRSFVRVF